MEGLCSISIAIRRGRWLPDAGSNASEHVLELALRLAERPPVGVGSEREDLALTLTLNRKLYVTWPSLRSCTRISPLARFSIRTS
jgi:hypothetical protein